MRRAMGAFRAVGFLVEADPVDFRSLKAGGKRARTRRVSSQRIYSIFHLLAIRPVDRPVCFSLVPRTRARPCYRVHRQGIRTRPKMNPHVAVLIPCYNEAATIAKVVQDFRTTLPSAVIYVYDNNSTDATAETARSEERRVGKE